MLTCSTVQGFFQIRQQEARSLQPAGSLGESGIRKSKKNSFMNRDYKICLLKFTVLGWFSLIWHSAKIDIGGILCHTMRISKMKTTMRRFNAYQQHSVWHTAIEKIELRTDPLN